MLELPDSTPATARAALGGAEPDAAAQDVVATALRGVLIPPPGFPTGGSALVRAWPDELVDPGVARVPVECLVDAGSPFAFEGLSAGTWTVSARLNRGERSAWGRHAPVHVAPGSDLDPLRIALTEFAVRGVVLDSAGRPRAGARVNFQWRASDAQAGQMAEIEAFPEQVDLGPDAEIDLILEPGGTLRTVVAGDLEALMLTLEEDAREEVQIIALRGARGFDPGPNTNLVIETWYISEDSTDGSRSSWTECHVAATEVTHELESAASGKVWTDAGGQFEIPLEGPGRVRVHAPSQSGGKGDRGAGSGSTGARDLHGHTAVTVAFPRGTVQLAPVRGATGRVLTADGEPAVGVKVSALEIAHGETYTSSPTDADGRFRIQRLLPLRHEFRVEGNELDAPLHIMISPQGDRLQEVGVLRLSRESR